MDSFPNEWLSLADYKIAYQLSLLGQEPPWQGSMKPEAEEIDIF